MNISDAAGLIGRFQTTAIPLLAAVVALQLFLLIFLWLRLNTLSKKYTTFMAGSAGGSLESRLNELLSGLEQEAKKNEELRFAVRDLQQTCLNMIQHVGIVRFNAFPDAGSDLSFAIAMLDEHRNGFVFSSIFGRDESRVYAKPIHRGQSEYHLSQEEKQALEQATKAKKI
ncbi:MAG: DUF4446 family protein [Firmicutes bacterium]|nr:DUF4446 family protein [Bacillota bacterium]